MLSRLSDGESEFFWTCISIRSFLLIYLTMIIIILVSHSWNVVTPTFILDYSYNMLGGKITGNNHFLNRFAQKCFSAGYLILPWLFNLEVIIDCVDWLIYFKTRKLFDRHILKIGFCGNHEIHCITHKCM